MNYKQNLHTHTIYCDGKNTPQEVIDKAIESGFDSIGFSGHSYMTYSPIFGMEDLDGYIKEISRLKEEYKDKLDIFCGIEYDMYSGFDVSGFDYRIGSAHYFKFGEEYVGFDRSKKEIENVINTYFSGDGMKYAKKYYELLSELPKYGDFDIIAHFDLIAKHVENADFFDENSKEYLGYAVDAMESLKGKIPFFEVNTGAISRGYRTTPYPSIPLLKELKNHGFGAIISSDCHDADKLDCHFKEAEELLKACDFKEIYILTSSGFKPILL